MKKTILVALLSLSVCTSLATGRTISVDDNGPADFNNIQAAIDDANDGDTVVVKPGTYTGEGNRDIEFKGKPITVRSTDPNDPNIVAATIIDCQGSSSNPHRGFKFHSGEGANSVLAGITVTNGYGPLEEFENPPNPTWLISLGGGIFCDGSDPTITRCVISNNAVGTDPLYPTTDRPGAGGGVCSAGGNLVISMCTITNNSASSSGGGIYSIGGSPTITNCILSNNQVTYGFAGGGIFVDSCTINNCIITGNSVLGGYGGGIHATGGNIAISSCIISDNTVNGHPGCSWRPCLFCSTGESAYGGGLSISSTTDDQIEIQNCIFLGNVARGGGGGVCGSSTSTGPGKNGGDAYGGAIYSSGHCITIQNCTIFDNIVEGGPGGKVKCPVFPPDCDSRPGKLGESYGGAICCRSADTLINNSILWYNSAKYGSETAVLLEDENPSHITLTYCDIEALQTATYTEDTCTVDWGPGNIDFIPMLTSDGHLSIGSLCINAGDPNYNPSPGETDIDKQSRIMVGRIDIGADEFPPPQVTISKPAGGEFWTSGSTHQIKWSSNGTGAVDILFSKDEGGNWKTIESDISNTGSYLWHLPDIVDSNQCLIKVIPHIPDSNVVCVESGLFTVHPDSPDPMVESKWNSLGGDSKRTGLSKDQGPEYGCVKWKFQPDGPISTSVTIGVVNRVHIACEDGKLYTLNPNGSLLWSYDVNSPLINSPTIGPDGTVYVGSQNGKLYAIDINGELRWTHTTAGPVSSSPAVSADGNIYVGSQDGLLYALAPDGSTLWSFRTKGPGVVPDGSIFASPSIGADGTVYIAGLYDPNLYALDPNNGSVKWTCNFESGGWPFASPVVAQNGTIYQTLLYDSNMYAIEPNDGTITWSVDLADPHSGWFDPNYGDTDGWSEPALGPDGTIYVSFDDPYLRAVDPNGTIKWVTPLGTLGGFTLTIGNDGLIYTAGDDGTLRVVDANGWEMAQFSSDDWLNYPVIAADNMVIVSDARDNSVMVTDANNTVWAISQHGCRDLNADETINYIDLALLAADWLECTDSNWPCNYQSPQDYLAGDIDRDRYVRLGDLTAMAARWSDDVKWLKAFPLPGPASNPNPPDGATGIMLNADLSWTPGPYAAKHDVYFGTSDPPPFICTQTAATFAPEPMEDLTTYFWRIDGVNVMGKTTGNPWTFTTQSLKTRCFPGNTPIWIEGALVPISKVVSGQRVGRPEGAAPALYLPDSTNRQEVERVVEHVETPLACYDIVLETENVITVVDTHYFLTEPERWLVVQELKAGMKLKSLKGPIGIRCVEKRQRPFTDKIYNLNIKDSDRYFVGEDGIVVRDW